MPQSLKVSIVTGNTACREVIVGSLTELANYIVTESWSCGIFSDNYRNLKNFKEASLIAIDVDEGCTLEQAKMLFEPYQHIIATTRNHQKQKGDKPPCDRFRVILPLSAPITNMESNYATFEKLKGFYPFIDESCKDASRQFFKSVEIIRVSTTGILFEPVITSTIPVLLPADPLISRPRGILSSTTVRFCVEGAPKGKRHSALVKALMDFKQNNYTQVEALSRLSHLELMDEHAYKTVDDVYANRTPRHPPRLRDDTTGETEGWVREWLSANNVGCSYSNAIYMGQEYSSPQKVLRKMRIARLAQGYKPQKDDIDDIFREWVEERKKGHLKAVQEKIAGYDIGGEVELKKLCDAMFGPHEHSDLYHEVLRHFVWQVKRKLFGLGVEYHMMPIIYGPQGAGKTTAITKLLAPMNDLVLRPNGFVCIQDDRQARVFIDFPIIFFDEMSQAERADVNQLKNKISSPTSEYRPMGTNDLESGPNISTLLGASNRRVSEIIMDETGARRFFELVTVNKMNEEAINAIDYELIWKSASEAEPCPIEPYISAISAIQNAEFRHKGPIEEWLGDFGYTFNKGQWVASTDLLAKFNDWYGQKYTATAFGKALRRLGIRHRHTRDGKQWELSNEVQGTLKLVKSEF